MEARPKNTTTLTHVNCTLTDPAAGGCRPRAVTASAHPLHLCTGSAYPLHHSLALSWPARTHTPTHCPRTSTALPPSRCHCQRAPATPPHRHTASAYTLTTGLTPAAIRRRTRRGRRTMRCSKTCTAQTDRTQNIEQGALPHSPCTCTPCLAPQFAWNLTRNGPGAGLFCRRVSRPPRPEEKPSELEIDAIDIDANPRVTILRGWSFFSGGLIVRRCVFERREL